MVAGSAEIKFVDCLDEKENATLNPPKKKSSRCMGNNKILPSDGGGILVFHRSQGLLNKDLKDT